MKVELVDRNEAIKRAENIHDLAFAIAEASGTLPGYSSAPECLLWCKLSALSTQLRGDEVAVFINNRIAEQITEMKTETGNVIGSLLIYKNQVNHIDIIDNELVITYNDNIVEFYDYLENLDVWKFKSSNAKNKIPYSHSN